MAQRFPRPAFDIAQVRRFDPPLSLAVRWFAAAQFVALLQGAALFLWFAEDLPWSQSAVWVAALVAALWALGAMLQGRLSPLALLLVEAAALATASSAVHLVGLHQVFKPLTMAFAIVFAASRTYAQGGARRFDHVLMAALTASLAGDMFLMFPGYFMPGLLSFLIAHLFYIALLRQGLAWLPSRRALLVTLGLGAAMYALLWSAPSSALRVAARPMCWFSR